MADLRGLFFALLSVSLVLIGINFFVAGMAEKYSASVNGTAITDEYTSYLDKSQMATSAIQNTSISFNASVTNEEVGWEKYFQDNPLYIAYVGMRWAWEGLKTIWTVLASINAFIDSFAISLQFGMENQALGYGVSLVVTLIKSAVAALIVFEIISMIMKYRT